MSRSRRCAVEREARRLLDELTAGRRARLVTADETFRREVLRRLDEMWRGDTAPRVEEPDD